MILYHFKTGDSLVVLDALWDLVDHGDGNAALFVFPRRVGSVVQQDPD